MKYALFFIFSLCCTALSAQNCSYAKKKQCSTYAKKSCNYSAAAMVASLDENVLSVFDTEDMKTKYIRKTVCDNSGSVSFEEVAFDKVSGQFVAKSGYDCDWTKCLKRKNCCILPMSANKETAVAVALESTKKKRT